MTYFIDRHWQKFINAVWSVGIAVALVAAVKFVQAYPDFGRDFLWMMLYAAIAPALYALSKAKTDFRIRKFIFNTRKRFAFALLLNLLFLTLYTFTEGAAEVAKWVLSYAFKVETAPSVHFIAAAVGVFTVISIRGDEPQGVLR